MRFAMQPTFGLATSGRSGARRGCPSARPSPNPRESRRNRLGHRPRPARQAGPLLGASMPRPYATGRSRPEFVHPARSRDALRRSPSAIGPSRSRDRASMYSAGSEAAPSSRRSMFRAPGSAPSATRRSWSRSTRSASIAASRPAALRSVMRISAGSGVGTGSDLPCHRRQGDGDLVPVRWISASIRRLRRRRDGLQRRHYGSAA